MTESAAPAAASPRDLRNFGVTFGGVAAAFGLLLLWRGRMVPAQILLVASAAFFAIGAMVPGLLRPAYGPWMKFAEFLGYVNTRILLTLFFLVGITPTGLLMRLAGKDPMNRSRKPRGERDASYWTRAAPHPDGARHFERQF